MSIEMIFLLGCTVATLALGGIIAVILQIKSLMENPKPVPMTVETKKTIQQSSAGNLKLINEL